MAKIDEYKIQKNYSEKLRKFAELLNDSSCDKYGISLHINSTRYSFYGNSSTTSWPSIAEDEFLKQITIDLRELMLRAAERVEKVTENARREAQAEAKEILAEIN